MKDQQEKIRRPKVELYLILLIFVLGLIAYNLLFKKEFFWQSFSASSKKPSASLAKIQPKETAFDDLFREKEQLNKSIETLRQKGLQIEILKMELTKKIEQASEKIKPSIRFIPDKESTPKNGMIGCSYSRNSEEVERELQTIQYNKAYIGKLDEMSKKVRIAIIRSTFIAEKFDTDIQVANVIGRETIQKMREEVNNKIRENIPLSTNINLDDSDFKDLATLDEIWQTLYKECTDEHQKRKEILSNLERYIKTKLDLQEKISTIKKLTEESQTKIESASQKIKNLRSDDRVVTKVDSTGMLRYPNYAQSSFELIEWDKSILKDLQTIIYQEAYLEELKTMEGNVEAGKKKSEDASQGFNGYSLVNLIELIYLDKKKEDYAKITEINQENWQLLATNNPHKIKVKPTTTPKEIWDRFKVATKTEEAKVENSSNLPPSRPGYFLHQHNKNEPIHEHPERCVKYSDGTSACGSY